MKSVEAKFAEACDALKKANKFKTFEQQRKPGMSIETQLNCAEAVLKDAGVVRTKESTPIKKNAGAAEMFVEGSPFNGDRGQSFSEGYVQQTTDPCAKGDKIMFDELLKLGKITESEHAKMLGQKPSGYEQLSEQKKKDYDFARLIGLSEQDAFRLVKIAGSDFRESRR
jgi:hypothetical protein